MSILKVREFNRTFKGRVTSFFLSLVIFNLNSCTVYTSAETNLDYVRTTNQITENLDVYKFYVHDQFGSYLLENPVFNSDGSISGKITEVNYQKPDSTWSNKDRRAYWDDHKYDIGIYTAGTVSNLRADLNENNLGSGEHIKISSNEIEKMTITSIDKEGELGAAALVVLIILGIIVVIGLMIILITVTATASSDGVNSSSDGSSDGSNSNSDSGSGGSGSGSSG